MIPPHEHLLRPNGPRRDRFGWFLAIPVLLALLMPALASAQTVVNDELSLRTALASQVNGTILFGNNITLTADLPSVQASGVIIDGGGFTLSGNNQYRGLVVAAFSPGTGALVPVTVTIQNLNIQNTVATGGAGGAGVAGGGGGAGLGGALFIAASATVNVSNVNLSSNYAVGGAGGAGGGVFNSGGGGGLGGAGGAGDTFVAGGGGGAGSGATGGTYLADNGGAGIFTGAATGATASGGGVGGIDGGGGGAIGGTGNTGGGGAIGGFGSDGGYGGGGGGLVAFGFAAGNGGFGGGGGGADGVSAVAGAGGFGGGGGGSTNGTGGLPGVLGGAGDGVTGGGGGGAGLGGAIFLTSGGQLYVNGPLTINGASVAGGTGAGGATDGLSGGSGIFLQGFSYANFAPGAGETAVVSGAIDDELGFGQVYMTGAGRLVLSGTNHYSGGTYLSNGTLSVATTENLGLFGDVNFDSGVLEITGTSTFNRNLIYGGSSSVISVAPGQTATWTGFAGESESIAALRVTGGGAVALTNTTNEFSLGTFVTGGSEVIASADGSLGIFGNAAVNLGDATSGGALGFASSFTTSRSVVLGAGGGMIDAIGSSTATVSGVVSGSGGLTKTGTGALFLTGANMYAGGTTVSGGLLVAGSASAFGTSRSLVVGAGATADFNGFNQSFYTLGGTGTIGLTSGARLTVGADGSTSSFGGTLTGTGGITKTGAGTLALSGTSTYSGTTDVLGGTLQAGSNGAFGASSLLQVASGATLDLNGFNAAFNRVDGTGTVALNGGGRLTIGADGSTSSFNGTLSGTGGLTKAGGGTLTLFGSNTYTGSTEVNGGTVVAGSSGAFGASRALLVANGASVNLNGYNASFGALGGLGSIALTGGARLTVGTDGLTSSFGGTISGTGGLTKDGAGSLTLSGTNTYSGTTSVLGGTLVAGSAQAFGISRFLSVGSGGTVDFNGYDQSLLSLSGSGAVLLNGGAQLTLGTENTDVSFAGNVGGSGGIFKTGSGTLALSGNNTFTGGLTVESGRLAVSSDASLGASNGTLTMGGAGGATLAISSGNFTSTRPIVLGSGGVVVDTIGGATNAVLGGNISGGGGLTKVGSGTLALTGALTFGGPLQIQGGTLKTNQNLQGNIINNGAVNFDSPTNGTYAGVMSGSGLLLKNGAGALTLSGANTYSGGTLVSGGTLIGNTTSLRGLIVTDAGLAFNQVAAGTGLFNGTVAGTGALAKLGAGTLTLTGVNPFTGQTTVGQGTLVLNGIIGGNVTVAPQAVFRLNGSVLGNVNVGSVNAGDLAGIIGGNLTLTGAVSIPTSGGAGSAFTASRLGVSAADVPLVPTLAINGDLVATGGSSMAMSVVTGGAAPIFVNGSATLANTNLEMTVDDPSPARVSTYVALTAEKGLSVSGTTVTGQSPSIVPVVKSDGRALRVTLLNYDVPLGSWARGRRRPRARPHQAQRHRRPRRGDPRADGARRRAAQGCARPALRRNSRVGPPSDGDGHQANDGPGARRAVRVRAPERRFAGREEVVAHAAVLLPDVRGPRKLQLGRRERRHVQRGQQRGRIQHQARGKRGGRRRRSVQPRRAFAYRGERLEPDDRTPRLRLLRHRLGAVPLPRRRQRGAAQDDHQAQHQVCRLGAGRERPACPAVVRARLPRRRRGADAGRRARQRRARHSGGGGQPALLVERRRPQRRERADRRDARRLDRDAEYAEDQRLDR